MTTAKKKKPKTPLPLRMIGWAFPKVEFISQWLANRWFVQLFFTPVKYKTPYSEQDIAEEATKYTIDHQGKKVQVYEWGEGKPVLFVHGWMGRGTQFKRFVPVFNKAGYKLVSFDAVAHGKSEGKKSHLLFFIGIINQLKTSYDFQLVVGHSLGGVASLHAVLEQQFVNKLVMISSPTIADKIVGEFMRRLNASPKVYDYFQRYVKDKYNKPFEEFSASYIIKDLKNVELLLIHDKDDPEVSMENPLTLKAHYPNAQIMQTEGLGHTRILKDETVIKACLDYVKDHPLNPLLTKEESQAISIGGG